MNHNSPEQIKFIQHYKRKKYIILLFQLLILISFLIIWQISADKNIIDSFIFSSPSKIITCLLEMLKSHELTSHILITLYETLLSFLFVNIIGIGCAIILWIFPMISQILEPYLVVLNSLPKSALAPLLIVWLGANTRTIIVAGISVALFGSILNLYTGFTETDPEKLKLIATLGGTKFQMLTKIVLPAAFPLILSVMKVNIGLCLVGVIIGEFIGARRGLGYLIIYGSQTFKLTWVLMSILLLCFIAALLYGVLNFLEKYSHKKV